MRRSSKDACLGLHVRLAGRLQTIAGRMPFNIYHWPKVGPSEIIYLVSKASEYYIGSRAN